MPCLFGLYYRILYYRPIGDLFSVITLYNRVVEISNTHYKTTVMYLPTGVCTHSILCILYDLRDKIKTLKYAKNTMKLLEQTEQTICASKFS